MNEASTRSHLSAVHDMFTFTLFDALPWKNNQMFPFLVFNVNHSFCIFTYNKHRLSGSVEGLSSSALVGLVNM